MRTHECYCYRGCSTEWEQEILLYMDHELSPGSCERVQHHLDRCEECARFYRIFDREEKLLSGRLRHQVESTTDPDVFADLVMSDIPAFQPITFPQRMKDTVGSAVSYFMDRNRRHYSLAASILICVMGLLFSMKAGNVMEEQFIHIARNGSYGLPVSPKQMILVNQDEGEFFELPDGSIIYATKDTWFSIDSYSNNKRNDSNINEERSLSLHRGTICIDVHPHPDKIGFSITCPNAKATVFGTQFYVNYTSGPNRTTTVGVREGQVMVEKKGKKQIGRTNLHARQMTTVTTFNGDAGLKPPYPLRWDITKMLDTFNEARSNRSARRMLPVLDLTHGDAAGSKDALFDLPKVNLP